MTIKQLILGVAEAAARIDLSKKTVYALQHSDPTFPRIFHVAGKKSCILASELEAWVEQQHATRQLHPAAREGGQP